MFDPFGTKKQLILNTKRFQKNLIKARDLRQLILEMSTSNTPSEILIKRDDTFTKDIVSGMQFTFTASVYNPDLRCLLNKYYEDFYTKKVYEFHYNHSLHSKMTQNQINHCIEEAGRTEAQARLVALDKISHILFRDESAFSLYENYKERYGTDVYGYVYDGFGIPKTYFVSTEAYLPFSINFVIQTGLLNEYRGGRMKTPDTIQDERKFYTKILLEELDKI